MSKKPGIEREESISITDQATLKVILHPLRTRLRTAMSQGPRSVKELAEAVGMEQTKLYYHVKILLKAGIIMPAGRRKVGNLTETSYVCKARDYVIDPALALSTGAGEGAEKAVNSFISALRSALLVSCRRLDAMKGSRQGTRGGSSRGPRSVSMCIESLRLLPGEAEEFGRRVKELAAEYDRKNEDRAGADTYEIGYAIYLGAAPRKEG